MIARHSRVAAIGVLFMIFNVSQSSRTSLRGNKRQLEGEEAVAVPGSMDFSDMKSFSDIGMKKSEGELDLDLYDGFAPIIIEMPDDVANVTETSSGDKFDEGDARIIGGAAAGSSNNKVPNNQVMLLRQTGTNSAGEATYAPNNCGGTLITPCHVLTAGHCIGRYGANDAVLVNARNPYDPNNGGAKKWKTPISQEWAHSSYRSGAKPYDVGILKLQHCVPANLLGDLPPARISSSLPSTNSDVVVAGFGRTNPNVSTKPTTLRAVTVKKVSDSDCTGAYGNVIDSTQFCAGELNGGKDSCQGDSGGGLYKGTSPSTQELLGVVSWGSGCVVAGKPGVYASVPHFKSWINSQVCNDSRVDKSSCPICGGSYVGGTNTGNQVSDTSTKGTGDQVDCSYNSAKTITFNSGGNKSGYCKYMMPAWPNVGGVDWNQYCSIQKVKDNCAFACNTQCPYAKP